MAIYTLIRDWFVQYIFGGVDSVGNTYNGLIAKNLFSTDYLVVVGTNQSISFSDWLSTSATLVVLVLLVIALGCLVIGLFRLFRGLFALRG